MQETNSASLVEPEYQNLLMRISDTYTAGQGRAVQAVNRELIETYWRIGRYIVEFEQEGKVRADYGKALLKQLSRDLTLRHGKGFSRSNLIRIRQFYLTYPKGATQKWVQAGVFQRMHQMNVEEYDELKGIQWDWQSMDGALIVAPTRQAGGASAAEEGLGRNPTDRGRQGSKLHTLVDRNGIPLAVELVGANVHDSRLVGSTLENIVVERPEVTEEKPQALCLDKGYSYKRVEEEVLSHGYEPHIRRIGEEKKDGDGQKTHPAKRWVVERTNAWFKGFRALRTRYTCKGRNFLALIQLAASIIVFQACHPKKE